MTAALIALAVCLAALALAALFLRGAAEREDQAGELLARAMLADVEQRYAEHLVRSRAGRFGDVETQLEKSHADANR